MSAKKQQRILQLVRERAYNEGATEELTERLVKKVTKEIAEGRSVESLASSVNMMVSDDLREPGTLWVHRRDLLAVA